MFLTALLLSVIETEQPPATPVRLVFVTNAYAKVHPTENKIVYQSNASGDFDLYVSNGDGVTTKRIVSTPGNDITPEYSPDGKQLTFVSERDGNREVYVCDPDGGAQVNLTKHASMDLHPAWSPDGARLVFSSNRGNTDPDDYDIYVMKADGSEARNLTNAKDSYDGWPVWSPDQKRIAYASGPGGRSPTRIMLMDADGSNKRELTRAPAGTTFVYDTQPAFTPSGRRIVFTRYRDFEARESSELCLIEVPLV